MPDPCLAIIPARLASSRFPGKVLASETGKPLIQHVWEAAKRARRIERVTIATDEPRVAEVVRGFGGEVVMTSPDHPNGTSRLAEACAKLGLHDEAIVVNVQGDEPEIDPGLIDALVDVMRAETTSMLARPAVATIASPMKSRDDAANPNIVKVVCAVDGSALYFSRAMVPHERDGAGSGGPPYLRHVGMYAYRRSVLAEYVKLAETPLERIEKLEQLRLLEHKYRIAVAVRESSHAGIDTPEQYAAFVRRYQGQ